MYFVATDEFDVEDEDKQIYNTKMEMSRLIFEELLGSPPDILPPDIPIILFLNREDLLQIRFKSGGGGAEKLKKVYPGFSGSTAKDALDFMKGLFLQNIQDEQLLKKIRSHETCALDTESMVVVWKVIREHFVNKAIDEILI